MQLVIDFSFRPSLFVKLIYLFQYIVSTFVDEEKRSAFEELLFKLEGMAAEEEEIEDEVRREEADKWIVSSHNTMVRSNEICVYLMR